MTSPRTILIVGTGGRDFHVFNTIYRDDDTSRVLGFTDADLCPGEAERYPSCLCGERYPDGIPILPEAQLEELIARLGVQTVVFAYSEMAGSEVARLAARALAAGADFQITSPTASMLPATKPVIAVTAARTGSGKSPTVRYLAELLRSWGLKVAVVRHPLQVHSFAEDRSHSYSIIDDAQIDSCALPLRQPFEGLPGAWVFSGLDYGAVLASAQASADVILWDGAGNDLPFLRPRLHLVLIDALRAGDEVRYFPGEVSLLLADAVIINKCDAATIEQIEQVEASVTRVNPAAEILTADSPVIVENAERVSGRTVVVLEEMLTLSLGNLRPGAGLAAAHQVGVSAIISPQPHAVGSLARVYRRHPEAHSVLPNLGYSPSDLSDFKATLDATPSDALINATRLDLSTLLDTSRPEAKASFGLRPHDPERLTRMLRAAIQPR